MARAGAPRAWGLSSLAVLVYLFLYAPILVLVAFSFNRGRLASEWTGFTLEWYQRALGNAQVQSALANSLTIGLVTTVITTVIGTLAALALHRARFRGGGAIDGLVTVPIVVPEIVLAASLLLLFATAGISLGFGTVVAAHVAFCLSYAIVVVRARLAGYDESLEEAALDLGATPLRTFFLVTLPLIAPAVLSAALLVFSLSIDDYVVTSFVAGVGGTTLPLQIYSMVRSGVSPEINAISTLLLGATSLLLLGAFLLEQGRAIRVAAPPALAGLAILLVPFLLSPRQAGGGRELNLYIWSNYIAPETLRKFEARSGARVNVDLYDSNEALIAKMQAGAVRYDVIVPSDYTVKVLRSANLLAPIDHSRLPGLTNIDPTLLDQKYDPGNRYSVPYFWGTTGIAYDADRVPVVDSWNVLWDARYAGRILMLDDPREAFGAALKRRGSSLNTKDAAALRQARDDLIAQKPLVATYNSSNFEDILLTGDVWVAQGWSGQFAKILEQRPSLRYVVPKEGGTLFIDNLAIPVGAEHVDLAHEFIAFTLEPEIAAEICRTMQYSTPNLEARPLLPPGIRDNAAIFPPADVLSRLELIDDLGEMTLVYDRYWTEIKSGR